MHDLGTAAQWVASLCFAAGVFVLSAGVVVGMLTPPAKKAAERAVQAADKALADVNKVLEDVSASRFLVADQGADDAANTVTAAAEQTKTAAEGVKSTLEEIKGVISSLPENLRFAGLLVLVGTLLMSVATMQFGGTSIF